MKRVLSILITLVLLIGLSIPALSLAETPAIPSIKSASSSPTSVTVSWGAVKGALGYQVAWGKKGVSDLLDKTATTEGTSLKATGLSENTTYAFRVRAYYKSGTSIKYTSWSAKKFVTTGATKPAVPSITSISYSNGKVTLGWSMDSHAKGYEVSWSEKGSLIPWSSPKDVQMVNSTTITNRIITGTTMAFRVRAYWNEGTSLKYTSWSATKYVKTSGSASTGYWTAWSDWTKSRKTVTGSMQEKIRHHMWAAKCKNCGTHNPYWGSNIKCSKCRKALSSSNVSHVNVYPESKPSLKTISGRKNGGKVNGKNYWYCEPQYSYRYWKSK